MTPAPSPAQGHDAACDPAHESAARFHEYTSAADPKLPAIPYTVLAADHHRGGPTRVIPWDLSRDLACAWPATSPNLLAGFLRILTGESLETRFVATSQLFYVISGSGRTRIGSDTIAWAAGDIIVMPGADALTHEALGDATSDAALYWVTDAPLLAYLGAAPTRPRFEPTVYRHERLMRELARVRAEPGAERRNRMGIIMGNAHTAQTMTITHILWSLLNVLPARAVQKPHRHNSVALDLCISAGPGTYTLIARTMDGDRLVDPIRADWSAGSAFVTPPGWWHSHHNESGEDAFVLPIQDAGLHTWMRTLDIQFTK